MKLRSIFGVLLASCLVLANCTEPPPLQPGEKNPPVEGKTPGETGTPGNDLQSAGQMSLPREVHALFAFGDTSYACTPEGGLYEVKVKDMRRFQLAALDLATGKQKWAHKGSACVFRAAGESIFSVRDLTKTKNVVIIDRLNAKTGKVEATIEARHNSCVNQEKSGAGEKMFATSSEQPYSCFDFSVQGGKLLFHNQTTVQLFDAATGKGLWRYEVEQTEGRIVSAVYNDGVVYVMEGAKTLAKDAIEPAEGQNSQSPDLVYQVRAIKTDGQESQWVVGPFFGTVVQSRLSIHGDAVVVQALSSVKLFDANPGQVLEVYSGQSWTGNVRTYKLALSTGKAQWKQPATLVFTKYDKMPIPTLPVPIMAQGGLLLQVPGVLKMVSVEAGAELWRLATSDTSISSVHMISSEHLHMRSSQGKITLLKLIPKKAPEATRGNDVGSLLYAADGIAPETGTSTKAGPKRRFSATGYCVRLQGKPVPLGELKGETRFFLPPPSSYGSSRSSSGGFFGSSGFFGAFCAKFLIDVQAFDMDGKEVWKSRAFVNEAPVFYFVRGNKLIALSDNGEWYQFKL